MPAHDLPETVLKVFFFSDLVDSTGLKGRLGDLSGAGVIRAHDELFRECLSRHAGHEEDNSGDGFFATFDRPSDALRCALAFQSGLTHLETQETARVRVGIHLGEIVRSADGPGGGHKLVGLAMDVGARVMSLAEGGQILLTRAAFDSCRQQIREAPSGSPVVWLAHGTYLLKGVEDPIEIFEAGVCGVAPLRVPKDSEKAKRSVALGDELTLGWRPATGLEVPGRNGWRLDQKLGEGGFGEVWLSRHERSKEVRTFKFCYKAERLRTLKRELTLFRLLKESLGERPDISRLVDVNLDEAPYFLELEYTPGGDLLQWSDRGGGIGQIPMQTRLEIISQIGGALAAAHSVGVIHKDVKPTNILIEDKKDGSIQAKLTDFGIGALVSRSALEAASITASGFSTQGSTVLTEVASRTGTRLYMAPELLAGREPSAQSDIYALGVLAFQLAIGNMTEPLGPGWERDIEHPILRKFLARCVDRKPQERFQDAAELRLELEKVRADLRHARIIRKTTRILTGFTMACSVLLFSRGVLLLLANPKARNGLFSLLGGYAGQLTPDPENPEFGYVFTVEQVLAYFALAFSSLYFMGAWATAGFKNWGRHVCALLPLSLLLWLPFLDVPGGASVQTLLFSIEGYFIYPGRSTSDQFGRFTPSKFLMGDSAQGLWGIWPTAALLFNWLILAYGVLVFVVVPTFLNLPAVRRRFK